KSATDTCSVRRLLAWLGQNLSRGPFIRNFSEDPRFRLPYAPGAQTIVLADMSRLIRNRLIHQTSAIPKRPAAKAMSEIYAIFEFPNDPGAEADHGDRPRLLGHRFRHLAQMAERLRSGRRPALQEGDFRRRPAHARVLLRAVHIHPPRQSG